MSQDKKGKTKREDTSISLHPLSFEEAIEMLAQPTQKDSPAEESGSTKSDAPESETSKRRTSRRRKSSDDSA